MKIREKAYAYLHGHEVGGTNPSLLEALGSTDLNLLFDVGFNREVAEDSALYWTKEPGDLAALLERSDSMGVEEIERFNSLSSQTVLQNYSWDFIAQEYFDLFACGVNR